MKNRNQKPRGYRGHKKRGSDLLPVLTLTLAVAILSALVAGVWQLADPVDYIPPQPESSSQEVSEAASQEDLLRLIRQLNNDPEVHIVDLKQFNRADFPFEKAHISPDYKWRSSNAEVPIYNYEDKAIWGLTARITRNMVQILKGEKK